MMAGVQKFCALAVRCTLAEASPRNVPLLLGWSGTTTHATLQAVKTLDGLCQRCAQRRKFWQRPDALGGWAER